MSNLAAKFEMILSKMTWQLWNSGDMVWLTSQGTSSMSCILTLCLWGCFSLGSSVLLQTKNMHVRLSTNSIASCVLIDWWLSGGVFLLEPIPARAQRSRTFFWIMFVFFFKIIYLLFWQNILSWGSIKINIYLKCAQAQRASLSFILFLSHIAHTPFIETWCTRHFNF